jgi:hypothetical protein
MFGETTAVYCNNHTKQINCVGKMLQKVGHEATGYQSSFSDVKGSANEVNH